MPRAGFVLAINIKRKLNKIDRIYRITKYILINLFILFENLLKLKL